jgi:ATP adenylyltransferase
MSDCLFCEIDKTRIISENDLAYAIRDGFPVTEYHTLIIPKRHAETYFDMTSDEKRACDELLHLIKNEILSDDKGVTGFNIGMNAGASAGQTIFHSHIHLIPRRDGDVEQPRGGVRGVIPNKQKY